MTAFEIHDIQKLTGLLLGGTMFDNFLLSEVTVTQAFTCTIDGSLHAGYFSDEELEEGSLAGLPYIPYVRVRPLCLELLKGKRKPRFFKFVFLLSPQNQERTIQSAGSNVSPEDVTGMFLNLTYRNNRLVCTTGVSYRSFTLDKSLEREWDRMALVFFRQRGIAVESLT